MFKHDTMLQVLFAQLPAGELVSSLCELLKRKKLYKSSNLEWQSCALLAIDILMSQSALDSLADANQVNDVIVTSLPLLFVHRHGNTFAGKVATTIERTSLAKQHPLFTKFGDMLQDKGDF